MLAISTIQAVKEIEILDIVSKYHNTVDIKKHGNLFKCCCPFHVEKSSSFTINTIGNYYKCFGCGKAGDGIKFVMDFENLDFIKSIEKIAADFNIKIEHEKQTEEEIERQKIKETLFDATNFANKFFVQNIKENKEANEYLSNRNITQNEIEKWQIGFVGESNFIKNYALENAQVELFFKASLLSSNSKNTSHFEFFRNRIMIPIFDAQNKIISFSGRAIDEQIPKYLNGRTTDIFEKSKILFGVNNYKKPFKNCNYSIMVEGYFDVISMHKIGCTNTLANNGTDLKKEQAKIFKKFADDVIIFYDNDKKENGTNPGLESCIRNIDTFLQEGLNVKVYTTPIGKDADDLSRLLYALNPNGSIAEFFPSIAQDGVVFKANYLLKDVNTPTEISNAKNAISETIYKIKNEVLRNEYIKLIAQVFKDKKDNLLADVKKIKKDLSLLNNGSKEFALKEIEFFKANKNANNSVVIKENELLNFVKNIEEIEIKKRKDSEKKKDFSLEENDYPEWYDNKHQRHMNTFYFTELLNNELTGYYFKDEKWNPVRQTNFVLIPLYTIRSNTNPRRMCEVYGFNNITKKMISEVMDFDEKQILKKEQFESRLAKLSPFILFNGYTNGCHNNLKNKIMMMFEDCEELNTLGSQPEKFWAFANICFEFPNENNPVGLQRDYNDYGVVKIENINFLSESKNKSAQQIRIDNNNPYENDLFFIYKKSNINFKEWTNLHNKVYGDDKAWLGVAFAIITIFRDVVSNFTKIPHLHCYGEKGSGKSEFAESIFHLFFSGKDSEGKLYQPFNLTGGGTPYAFHRRLERFRNCPQVLNEYDDTNIFPEFFDAIKATFDGEGRERGSGVKGKTEIMKRNATLILLGQKIGNRDDNSVLTRSITVEFLKPEKYEEEARTLMAELKQFQKDGLSSLILEILTHREYFFKRFREEFYKNNTELNNKVSAIYQKTEARLINSTTALQLCYTIISEKIKLPISSEVIKNKAFNKCLEMHAHLQSTDGLSEFWKIIEFLLDRNELEEDWEFKVRSETKVKIRKTIDGKNIDEFKNFTGEKKLLYIRLSQLIQLYSLHVNRTSKSERPLTEKTIATYMSSQPYYIGLCPGTSFKSLINNKSINSTSCYVLDYEKIGVNLERQVFEDERNEEIIFGEITKINETSGDIIKFTIKGIITTKSEMVDKNNEQYTNCFIKTNNTNILSIIIGKKIKIKGMCSKNNKGFRNMDVIEILPEETQLQKIF